MTILTFNLQTKLFSITPDLLSYLKDISLGWQQFRSPQLVGTN